MYVVEYSRALRNGDLVRAGGCELSRNLLYKAIIEGMEGK